MLVNNGAGKIVRPRKSTICHKVKASQRRLGRRYGLSAKNVSETGHAVIPPGESDLLLDVGIER